AGQDPVEFGSPAVTRDVVFVATETKGVEAFERTGFHRKWQFHTKNGVSSELLLEGNVLYFGAMDGNFYALDAEFGKVLWKYETKTPVFARGTIAGKRIFITTSDDVVYCLDQTTGKWIWHYKRGGNYITTVHGNSTPAVENGLAYVGFSDGYLVALNANDGNLVWEQKIHRGSKFTDVDAMVLLDGDRLYVPSYDGELYALERAKGRVLWHIEVGGSKKVLMDDKTLYLASSNGSIYSINKDTGKQGWKFELDSGTPTNLIQHDSYLAFGGSQQYFYVLHKGDGSLAYRYSAGLRSGYVSSPVQSERDIFALSNFGNLYVFRWNTAAAGTHK
ncbi:MAG: PQQ-binding-like beta-propeller repeat protein, partial [Deltaproteobacteria bacterium]|nr:PQQ-binding-like beta-propeller repeat protein [Deltaproteobacteria bacterium]